jgi:Protein of unknown function (DUF1570)
LASTGPHILLLHQHSDAEAAERIALLERVITGFYLTMAAEGLDLKVPTQRLVSAWFANQSDYLNFLKQNDGAAFATTRGYFHPTWNAVVAYDGRTHESQRQARQALEANHQEVRRARELLDTLPPKARLKLKMTNQAALSLSRGQAQPVLDRLEREAATQAMLLELDWRAVDMGTAAHEVIHQLVTGSGLAPRHDAFPHWLHEGFACQFEVIRGGRWAGISRAHDLRMPDWRKIQAAPNLERLVRDGGFNHGYQRDLYAQAWALVYFLRTQHPDQFVAFLDRLRGSSFPIADDHVSESTSGDRIVNVFRRSFGNDLTAIEREWQTFMAGVRTPLEMHAPDASPTAKSARPSFSTLR